MPSTQPGRNDPCPCGSGRKYKHCCLVQREAEGAKRSRLREAEGRVVPLLFQLALERWGQPFFAEAWEEFFLWDNVPSDIDTAPEFPTIFLPWFVFSFVRDPSAPDAIPDAPDQPVAMVYAGESGDALSDADRRFIETACRSAFSFYVVKRVEPGAAMELQDVLTGHDCRALEQSASTMVSAGTILYALLVTIDSTSIMLGCAPLQIPPT